MLLLLMRHGIAQQLSDTITDDFHRPLTNEGRDRTHRAALGLHEIVRSLDTLVSSPKLRARQTAQIVRDVYGKKSPNIVEWTELMDDDLKALRHRLKSVKGETILLCGHQPHLSRFVSLLTTGKADALELDFKKAGVCALEVDVELPRATLLWVSTPKQLRKMAK